MIIDSILLLLQMILLRRLFLPPLKSERRVIEVDKYVTKKGNRTTKTYLNYTLIDVQSIFQFSSNFLAPFETNFFTGTLSKNIRLKIIQLD